MSIEGVSYPLPEPEQCDACASFDIVCITSKIENALLWLCQGCGASVGCHVGTRMPLGRMADKRTRQLRARAHAHLDPIWKSGQLSRDDAYLMLARHLNITREQCHISRMSPEQLHSVIQFCQKQKDENTVAVLQRRKEKQDARHLKRVKREKQHAARFNKYGKRCFRRPRRGETSSDED